MAPRYRLFALLAETQPDGAALARRLTDLDAEALLELAADVVDASADVRSSWEGPLDASGKYYWSEDSTEDLTGWIVAQGEAFWRAAVGASDEQLMALAPEYHRERADGRSARWNGRTPHLGGLVHAAYTARFADVEDYFDGLARVLDARAGDHA
ncbi:hypothetical protein SAMN02745121_04948 [Nannocystis exedens]|uniref:Uncharacterized protein n=1 Tax=Nannocystis exedens TaxID=54 RepID=A0A1I2C346_9BACT|nr:hypothetical protein [Nannocystis exedens]PCC71089.1 hypothetical protein NAEX_04162 [Nannocystis exedens]SFE62791.1 hypothetical protein SAMN02745121_04948 [Nannocystis exedens]